MPNSKISRIINNIEYRVPAGTLPEYKYGVKVNRVSPTHETPSQLISSETIESSIKELKAEMKKPASHTESLPQADLIK